jgi:hypothetical protein
MTQERGKERESMDPVKAHPLTTEAEQRLAKAEAALRRTEAQLEGSLLRVAELQRRRCQERRFIKVLESDLEDLRQLDERDAARRSQE